MADDSDRGRRLPRHRPDRPHRRRVGRPLLRGQEEDNAEHRRVRARVEHTFARMKNWKILRDCRQKGDGLHHAVQAVATMHNLAMTR
nr:transposase [Streptomyces sp. SJL17-1]